MINFKNKYNREEFVSFLRNDFLPTETTFRLEDITITPRYKVINIAHVLGENKDLGLSIIEMTHGKNTDPRISIATDAFKIMSDYSIQKALVIFKNNDTENYRFSYLTITLDLNDRDRVTRSYSNARRYSFYLGEGAKTKTPELQLVKQGKIKDIEDLQKRFSVEVVNKQFYLEIAKHFDELVTPEKNNLVLPSSDDILTKKSFAVRLIGRTMFCWFLKQKKSNHSPLISDEILSRDAVKENYYHNILEPLFFQVLNTSLEFRDIRTDTFDKVPYLNGGLFNPQKEDFYEFNKDTFTSKFINTLKISHTWFLNFFELLETYNFTIDENTVFDQELSVDPEMLGRIFENLLAEINPETGSSERKRTGSFYTPRQIVEYMVDKSLVEYLKTKTEIAEEKLNALVSYDLNDDLTNPLESLEKNKIIEAIETLKVLDPACGSGAFPIGVLQKVVYILQTIDPDCKMWLDLKLKNIPDLYKQKIINEVKQYPFDYTRKLDVIKNSIFGVDIQPIAVDVSRLRCFLTLMVESEVDDSKTNRGIDPLPNLDFKFVCANTLIGLPKEKDGKLNMFDDHSGIEELQKIMSEYFNCNPQRKAELKNKFTGTQKGILQKTVMSHGASTGDLTLALTSWDPFSNNSNSWFDPEWMFGLDNKFDVVIANPPYIDSETMVKEMPELRNLYSERYETAKGNWDLYIPFFEFAYNNLSENGIATFITPNKWFAIGYGKDIRKKIISHISRIGDCNAVKVFEAGNSPVVTFYKRLINGTKIIIVDKFEDNYEVKTQVKIKNEILGDNFGITLAKNLDLILKIKSTDDVLGKYFNVENPCTVSEAYEIQKIIEEMDPNNCNFEDYFLFANTGTIDPYECLWGKKLTTYLKHKYQNPVIKKEVFKLLFPKRYLQMARSKILISGMRHFESFLDVEGNYISGKSTEVLFKIGEIDLKFALGLINSKLIKFYISESYGVLGIDGGINFTPHLINNLPLPDLNKNSESVKKIITNVMKILEYRRTNKFVDTKDIENEIDRLVYELYRLTEGEIKIVEESIKE